MIKTENIFSFFYCLLLFFCIYIIYFFHDNIAYFEKNITDILVLGDYPFLKEIYIFNDLTLSLVIFLFIFCLINKWKNIILSFHFKIIWIVKSFFSFFLIMLYEQEEGLDQMNYFYLVINNITWTWHFGNLDNLIDINNTTVNFLLFMKAINFIFDQSWFMQKLFQNLLYLGTLLFIYKTLSNLNSKFTNNIFTLYLLAFTPSFFFFSSLITKDILILFLLSIILFIFFSYRNLKKKKTMIIITMLSLAYIGLLRWWVSFSIVISFVIILYVRLIEKFTNSNKYLVFISLNSILFLFFFYSTIYTDNAHKIFPLIFNRITVEHLYPIKEYSNHFINSGTKFEVLKLYPSALFKTIFNPFLKDIFNFKLIIFIIENVIILFFLIFSIKNFKKKFFNKLVFPLSFFIIISHFYLFIGYLNSGTTVRYALQAKLFLIFFIIIMNDDFFEKINKKLLVFFKIFINKVNNKSKNY